MEWARIYLLGSTLSAVGQGTIADVGFQNQEPDAPPVA
jgi:hypothetical protein